MKNHGIKIVPVKSKTPFFLGLVKLSGDLSRQSINEENGGFEENLALIYLRAAYGHASIALLEQMASEVDLYGSR